MIGYIVLGILLSVTTIMAIIVLCTEDKKDRKSYDDS